MTVRVALVTVCEAYTTVLMMPAMIVGENVVDDSTVGVLTGTLTVVGVLTGGFAVVGVSTTAVGSVEGTKVGGCCRCAGRAEYQRSLHRGTGDGICQVGGHCTDRSWIS